MYTDTLKHKIVLLLSVYSTVMFTNTFSDALSLIALVMPLFVQFMFFIRKFPGLNVGVWSLATITH